MATRGTKDLLLLILITFVTVIPVCLVSTTSRNARSKDMEKYTPRRVIVQAINGTSVRLQWDQPTSVDTVRCPIARYTVRLKADGAKRSRTWKVDGNRQSLVLHDLVPGSSYYVRVLAVVCDGKGRPSPWVGVRTARSVSDAPPPPDLAFVDRQQQQQQLGDVVDTDDEHESSTPGKPSYVRTRTFSDSVIVSWLPPEDNSIVRGYMVGYGEGVPDVNWQYVDASRNNVTIKNLKPATQYIISLRAFNNHGKGQVIYDLIYTRELAGPTTTGPVDLRTKVLSPSAVWLEWTDPTLGRPQQLTDGRYYNVHYRPIVVDSETGGGGVGGGLLTSAAGRTLSVVVKELHVGFYDLQPGTRYEFKVRTVKDAVASPFSEPIVNKTFETAPSSPPRSLTLMTTNVSGTVHVTWRPPRLPNGDVIGYLILYTEDPELPYEQWHAKSVSGSQTETTIANLTLDVTFHFRIQARNMIGYSPLSSNSIFYTKIYTTSTASTDSIKTTPSWISDLAYTQAASQLVKTDGSVDETEFSSVNDVSTTASEEQNLLVVQGQPRASKLVQQHVESSKAKRHPGSADDTPKAIEEPMTSPDMTVAAAAATTTTTTLEVPFRAFVQHWVSAFITWPQSLKSSCNKEAPGQSSVAAVVGYQLRYGHVDTEMGKLNLTVNVALIDNLRPYTQYWYQLKYVYADTSETEWTSQQILDTS